MENTAERPFADVYIRFELADTRNRVRLIPNLSRGQNCWHLRGKVAAAYSMLFILSKALYWAKRKYKGKELLAIIGKGTNWVAVTLSTLLLLRATVILPE